MTGCRTRTEALQRWADEQALRWAVRDAPEGERWGARFESYVTDPSSEPDPTRLRTDIAYLLAD